MTMCRTPANDGAAVHASSLSFTEAGAAGGLVLLLIHPMGADSHFWDACSVFLQQRHRCIAVDLRGAGGSPASGRPISVDAHARDLAALVAVRGAGKVVPVGCAVGAMVATAFAGLHPELCDALVLSNPGYRTLTSARVMLSERAYRVRREGMRAVMPGAVDNAFVGFEDEARLKDYARRFAAQDPVGYALQIEGMLDADISSHLQAIHCPVLILAGGRDGLLPPEHAHDIHRHLATAEFVEITDAAHFIPYQRPEQFSGTVIEFLDRVTKDTD